MKSIVVGALLGSIAMMPLGHAQGLAGKSSQKVLLKNWALSRCLSEVYTDEKTKEDANATAGAYLEFGRQNIEAYEALNELVVKYAKRKYTGSVPSDFNTMKCIDLFHSSELEALAARLSRKRD